MSGPLPNYPRNRYCGNCQFSMKEQSVWKRKSCPQCKSGVPLSDNIWDADGWGRCPLCHCFYHRTHPYCEVCSFSNSIGLAAKRRREQEARRQEVNAKNQRISQLEAELAAVKEQMKAKRFKSEDPDAKDEKSGDQNAKKTGNEILDAEKDETQYSMDEDDDILSTVGDDGEVSVVDNVNASA